MKRKSLVIGLLLGTIVFTGCSKGLTAVGNNTMTIDKDGKIQDVSVEDFSNGNYDMGSLEQFINDEIEKYNTEAGSDSIVMKQLETENKLVKLQLSYSGMDDYNSFNNTEYKLDNLADVKLSGNLTMVSDGSTVAAADIEDKNYKVLQVTDSMDITFKGKALYYNSYVTVADGVFTSDGKGTAVIIFK